MDDQARLESAYLRKGIVGSNPTLSAKSSPAERSGNPAVGKRLRPPPYLASLSRLMASPNRLWRR